MCHVRVAVIAAGLGLALLVSACGGPAQTACHRLCSELAACYPRASLEECHDTCDRAPPSCANDLELARMLDECSAEPCGAMLLCSWSIAASRPECVAPGTTVPQS